MPRRTSLTFAGVASTYVLLGSYVPLTFSTISFSRESLRILRTSRTSRNRHWCPRCGTATDCIPHLFKRNWSGNQNHPVIGDTCPVVQQNVRGHVQDKERHGLRARSSQGIDAEMGTQIRTVRTTQKNAVINDPVDIPDRSCMKSTAHVGDCSDCWVVRDPEWSRGARQNAGRQNARWWREWPMDGSKHLLSNQWRRPVHRKSGGPAKDTLWWPGTEGGIAGFVGQPFNRTTTAWSVFCTSRLCCPAP